MSVLSNGVLMVGDRGVWGCDTARELLDEIGLEDTRDVVRLIMFLARDEEIGDVVREELGCDDEIADARADAEAMSERLDFIVDTFLETTKLTRVWLENARSSLPDSMYDVLWDTLRDAELKIR